MVICHGNYSYSYESQFRIYTLDNDYIIFKAVHSIHKLHQLTNIA